MSGTDPRLQEIHRLCLRLRAQMDGCRALIEHTRFLRSEGVSVSEYQHLVEEIFRMLNDNKKLEKRIQLLLSTLM